MSEPGLSIIPGVELTDKEKEVLRSIGKKAYEEMVRKLGKKKLAEIARKQGRHGVKGGRPSVYERCPKGSKATNFRHRFVKGVCKCGQRKLTPELS